MISEEKKALLDTINFPVNYEQNGQSIKDANGLFVCDVRGWGKIQFMDKAEERHDAIGSIIAELLNDFKTSEQTSANEK
ncbi:hypothetical protein [Zunongwangia sp. HGR-M22]|uniref:hypothetical protein n=1 Tax=Zunongwangia sp. HGR-M22 TaxID=3015168 RepID=UPI0022DD5841|nr:hypothetical protein [Zunongwangia sp. HGR-M22]WBL26811.1 hypothetical protein PBT91_05985 [Zunongwangia sp. HGR-M22]